MKILLDTHSFLWFVTDDPRLSITARSLIADLNNEALLSPASYWEVAIKVSLGKYPLAVPFDVFFKRGIEDGGMTVLPVEIHHAAVLSLLPMHHKDPFDRMIISQAIAEKVPVVSIDEVFDSYSVNRLW